MLVQQLQQVIIMQLIEHQLKLVLQLVLKPFIQGLTITRQQRWRHQFEGLIQLFELQHLRLVLLRQRLQQELL